MLNESMTSAGPPYCSHSFPGCSQPTKAVRLILIYGDIIYNYIIIYIYIYIHPHHLTVTFVSGCSFLWSIHEPRVSSTRGSPRVTLLGTIVGVSLGCHWTGSCDPQLLLFGGRIHLRCSGVFGSVPQTGGLSGKGLSFEPQSRSCCRP